MKFFLLAGVAAATLMAQAAEAVTFSYTGSVVQWVVPTSGTYRIVASGAQGGASINTSGDISPLVGLGATLGGSFSLNRGQKLNIAVGQAGFIAFSFFGGGGGGGGGFSGGAGGYSQHGGGGGSFNAGTDQEFLGFNTGNGSVSITALSLAVPEPSIWSMLISGFGLVGFALRRRVRMVLQGG
jgi:hypothetical protein